jgi:hypothetical protein
MPKIVAVHEEKAAPSLGCIDVGARRKAAFGCLAGGFPVPDDGVFFDAMSDEQFVEMFGEEFLALHKSGGKAPR